MEKIGFIVDSGSDVPRNIIETYEIEEVSLRVNFSDKTYRDKIDISQEDLFEKLAQEIPTTSLPPIQEVEDAIETLKGKGYNKIICIAISGGLSGTINSLRIATDNHPEVASFVLDTRSIGIGSGLFALAAIHYMNQGDTFESICQKLSRSVEGAHVFFHIPTLSYLIKGGRIGRVSGTLGNMLNIQPVITCDDDGIYTTVAKFRASKRQFISKAASVLTDLMEKAADMKEHYMLGFCTASDHALHNLEFLKQKVDEKLPNAIEEFDTSLSAALGVHTGPDLIGCAIIEIFE